MNETKRPKNEIVNSLKPLYGKPCWGMDYDRTVNLSFSFGDPVMTIRGPIQSKAKSRKVRESFARRLVTVKGKWWLWVFIAKWKLSFEGKRAVTNLSSYQKIQRAIAKLDGQILTNAEINPKTGKTRFEFDLGGVLEVRRWGRKSDDDLWMLYKPNGHVLTIRGDGEYSHQPGNTDSDSEKTFPLLQKQ